MSRLRRNRSKQYTKRDKGLAWKQHQENKKKSVKKYKAIDNTEYMEELVRKRGTNRKIKYDQKKIA